jgi:hypothetical protein
LILLHLRSITKFLLALLPSMLLVTNILSN